MPQIFEVFIVFLKLGLTSFGGPIAHLGYFHDEFVTRRKWIDEHAYADLVALCQFLPGPASSQVGISIGLSRAGIIGAIVAWIGFTLPSAILLVLFGLGISNFRHHISSSLLHGLKIVAVAVVAQAIWSMATKICTDKIRKNLYHHYCCGNCSPSFYSMDTSRCDCLEWPCGIAFFKKIHGTSSHPLHS